MTSELDASGRVANDGAEMPWVWLAKIRRPQGRKGEVLAELLTDFPEKFKERKQLWLLTKAGSAQESAREAELRHHWLHKGDVVLHFAGVDSISDAELLAGLTVAIPHEQRAALGEDEDYTGDLMGCTLVDVATEPERVIGVIEDVDRESGPVALLIVKGIAGEELLIPWAKAYLRCVDLAAKRIEMGLPEGLVDLSHE